MQVVAAQMCNRVPLTCMSRLYTTRTVVRAPKGAPAATCWAMHPHCPAVGLVLCCGPCPPSCWNAAMLFIVSGWALKLHHHSFSPDGETCSLLLVTGMQPWQPDQSHQGTGGRPVCSVGTSHSGGTGQMLTPRGPCARHTQAAAQHGSRAVGGRSTRCTGVGKA